MFNNRLICSNLRRPGILNVAKVSVCYSICVSFLPTLHGFCLGYIMTINCLFNRPSKCDLILAGYIDVLCYRFLGDKTNDIRNGNFMQILFLLTEENMFTTYFRVLFNMCVSK